MTDLLSKHIDKIKQLEFQKKRWMLLGLFFILYLVFFALNWYGNISLKPIFWIITGCIIVIITLVWWVWTMTLVNSILESQMEEIIILDDIVKEIKTVKHDIQELKTGK